MLDELALEGGPVDGEDLGRLIEAAAGAGEGGGEDLALRLGEGGCGGWGVGRRDGPGFEVGEPPGELRDGAGGPRDLGVELFNLAFKEAMGFLEPEEAWVRGRRVAGGTGIGGSGHVVASGLRPGAGEVSLSAMSKSSRTWVMGAWAAAVMTAALACGAKGEEPGLAEAGDALRLDTADASFRWTQPTAEAADEQPPAPRPEFGAAGSKWWTVGIAGADNFQNAVDVNISGAYSYFLAKDIEWALEGAAWHFNQPGDNAFGGSASMVLRWHFVDTGDWTVYADAGIGLLLATDDVPPDGTSFDFLPRAGLGFTRLLSDDGLRLQMGVRWHHISNARITSDSDNPGRDSAMIYAGLIFPF